MINVCCRDTDAFNFQITAYPSDTVQYIKRLVYEKFHFPIEKQILTFDNHQSLEDERNLLYYNIKANDNIELVRRMQLFVRTFIDSKIIVIDVLSSETVESVKTRVLAIYSITSASLHPYDQKVVLNGKRLDSKRALSYYKNLEDGSILYHGRFVTRPTWQIFIKTLT